MLRVLRSGAIVIAVLGVIDPAVTTTRSSKPEIAVVTTDSVYAAATAAVGEQLRERFTVIRAPFAGAAATVLVGNRIMSVGHIAGPVFVVLPESPSRISAVNAPVRAQMHSSVPVIAAIDASEGRVGPLEVVLRANGIVVDRRQFDITRDQQRITAPLKFVPTATGTMPLRVSASLNGFEQSVDLVVDVHDQRWPVLFYDARPSWQSTFVRRALERDPRFDVASRVLTSRNVSSDAGQPPQSLGFLTATAQYSAIVVGAPEALSEQDVTGLEGFMRKRAGTVILLLDQSASGPYRRLVGTSNWTTTNGPAVVSASDAPAERLSVTAIARPVPLPVGAQPIALDTLKQPVVWRMAMGQGQLIVSGALDSWKFRDPSQSAFDRFWRTLIAGLADAAAPTITVEVSTPLLEAGEQADVMIDLRDLTTLSVREANGSRASVGAMLETASGSETIRLWPEGVGRFRGTVHAPATPGSYRIAVTSDAGRAEAALTVAAVVARPQPEMRAQLEAWANSRGGSVLPVQQLGQLPDRIASALETPTRRESWHPMRSAWWIIPFGLLLGAEWWLRRRRGLA